ncbi:MAG: hypothetical protein HY722_08060 [Planctomycetes bacterium]|nr:hypothetical protein [Planctomycetota bacterium]
MRGHRSIARRAVVLGLAAALLAPAAPAGAAQDTRVFRSQTDRTGNSTIGAQVVTWVLTDTAGTNRDSSHSTAAGVTVLDRTFRAGGVSARVDGDSRRGIQDSGFKRSVGLDIGWQHFGVFYSITRTLTFARVGVQIFVGPVPVYVRAAALATAEVRPGTGLYLEGGRHYKAYVHSKFGIGVEVTAAVGVSVAYLGVSGQALPLQGYFPFEIEVYPDRVHTYAQITVRAYADIALEAKLFIFKYRKILTSWQKPYYAKTLVNSTLRVSR